jgi:hypothetical protein
MAGVGHALTHVCTKACCETRMEYRFGTAHSASARDARPSNARLKRGQRHMRVKKVYVNDVLIGEASTWTEVYKLLKTKNVQFIGKPGAAEGPSAFFLSGAAIRKGDGRSKSAGGVA